MAVKQIVRYWPINAPPSPEQEDVRNEPKVKAREGLEALRFYELQEDERVRSNPQNPKPAAKAQPPIPKPVSNVLYKPCAGIQAQGDARESPQTRSPLALWGHSPV